MMRYIVFLTLLFFLTTILIKPLLGLIISVPLILYFSYIDILWISPWNYLLFFLLVITVLTLFLRGKIKINKYSRRILIISILFLFWTTTINLIQGIAPDVILSYFLKLISVFSIGFCTMFFIKKERDLRIFCYSLMLFVSISSFVGIMQFLGIEFFWRLREIIGLNPDSIVGQQILQKNRVPGLSYFSISLEYQLASIIPLIFGILTIKKQGFFKNIGLKISLIVCFTGLFVALSKSAIIGGIIGLLMVLFLSKYRKKKKKIIFFMTFLTLFILILNTLTNNLIWENFTKPTTSTLSRIPLFLAAFKIFLKNPFGVGIGQFSNYGAEFFPKLSHLPGSHYILTTASHNQFLNTLVYFGIFGLLLLVAFYYYIFKGLFKCYQQYRFSFVKPPFIEGVSIGLIGLFTAYIINSMFHNAGPFLIDAFNWYFIGISMFLFNYCKV